MPIREYALLLSLTLGLMAVLSPYASGVNSVYYGSGYLPAADFWKLGGIFGVIFITVFLAVGVPWVLMMGLMED
jgi:L-tartrate/succinate antiporter